MPKWTADSDKAEARREMRRKNRNYKARKVGKVRDAERRERAQARWYR